MDSENLSRLKCLLAAEWGVAPEDLPNEEVSSYHGVRWAAAFSLAGVFFVAYAMCRASAPPLVAYGFMVFIVLLVTALYWFQPSSGVTFGVSALVRNGWGKPLGRVAVQREGSGATEHVRAGSRDTAKHLALMGLAYFGLSLLWTSVVTDLFVAAVFLLFGTLSLVGLWPRPRRPREMDSPVPGGDGRHAA